jgi:hypothetical protein
MGHSPTQAENFSKETKEEGTKEEEGDLKEKEAREELG